MNYLSGALRYVAGGDSDQRDAVPRLIDRIKTSALPQDRRAAIAALVDAAKRSPQQQVLVGELAIKLIYAVLEQDKDYDDNLKATLDLLIAICGTLDPPDVAHLPALLGDSARGMSQQDMLALFDHRTANAASTNVDMFLGMPHSVSLVLDLLEKTDFYVKFSAIELLTAMAANSRQTLQLAVLEAPQGVSRICDLLDDNNRLLRSNAVLLLSTLCDQSSEICKIVAYGGVLEKLFTLAESVSGDTRAGDTYDEDDLEDDSLEAAIVVQDVLLVLRNLVRGAGTTKTFMRDTACIPRLVNVVAKSAADANMLPESPNEVANADALNVASGRKLAVEKQGRKNLVAAMQCVSGLVKDGDNESNMIKNDLATTNIFTLLAALAFTTKGQPHDAGEKPVENALQVRIVALRTIAMLTRGHDDFRSMFGSVSVATSDQGSSTTALVAALRAMLGDSSASVRAAAYLALRESFVVDVRLDLPSSNLVNMITSPKDQVSYSAGGRGMGMSRGSAPSNSVQVVADSLKAAIIGWPNQVDPAGVFYSASLLAWLVARVQGARERMLSSIVGGSALLPQMIRLLGKVEREKGPPEIRIALFTFACVWLHNCPPAVFAFLSSAMHLPMLVDVLKGTGSRGDVAEVHVRGLAAVLLGICWKATDGANDTSSDSRFVSGEGVASAFIPKGTISDIIRNRIGITVITACLDDLRSTKAFALGAEKGVWALPEGLVALEDRNGLLSVSGGLGHERWYESLATSVFDDAYKSMGAKALDLLADQSQTQPSIANGPLGTVEMNGHAGESQERGDEQRALLADSTRDEVLNSYKEFIRSQDESLDAARRQIDELTTALRETQLELDSKIDSEAEVNRPQNNSEAFEELLAQREALQALLEEKNADFMALSDAYAALEEEHNSQSGGYGDGTGHTAAELSELQSQYEQMRDSLNLELSKNTELAHRVTTLECAVSLKDAELREICLERDQLKVGVSPDAAQSLQWKTEANLARAELTSSQSILQSLQLSKDNLNAKVMDLERYRADDATRIRTLEKQLGAAQSELHDLRSTRKRELQVAREASQAADAAAQGEIAQLRQELSKVRQDASGGLRQNDAASGDDRKRFEMLDRDHQALLSSVDQMKVEVMDTRNALSQWQRKSEAEEAEKNRQIVEVERLTKLSRDLGEKVQILSESLTEQTAIATSSSTRVSELEQQSSELDEMRRLAGEESKTLKEELATRTEQTIRLSGQLYEAEEGKARLEYEIERLTAQLTPSADDTDHTTQEHQITSDLEDKLIAVEEELAITKDALADARDRESLSQAQAKDREDVAEKAATLETTLSQAKSREAKLLEEITELKERLLSLDEAESAKRALTMQVVELQNMLESANSSAVERPEGGEKRQTDKDTIKRLDTVVAEKELRISGLESSLTTALDRIDIVEREKVDLGKQVTETETMLSVLQSQREALSARCDDLSKQVEEKPPYSEMDRGVLEQLERKLAESEQRRNAVSLELSSLVDACRLSEGEMQKIRNDCETQITGLEKELKSWKSQYENLSLVCEVDRFVSSLCCNVSLAVGNDANTEDLQSITHERDTAITSQIELQSTLDAMRSKHSGLQVALRECEGKLAESVSNVEKLTRLTMKLDDMQAVVDERDGLRTSLEAAKLTMEALEDERNAAVGAWEDLRQQQIHSSNRVEKFGTEGSTTTASDQTSQSSRVKELEDALRDAARTVSAMNLEVIATQALLVELSADKTAMRTELEAARREIDQLNAKLSIEMPPNVNGSAFSVVSEQEQLPVPSGAESEAKTETEFSERLLKAAHAEIENLQMTMQRSTVEAQSAASLVEAVTSKVQHLENRLQSAHDSLRESRAEKALLSAEMETLREAYSSEKDNLLNDIQASKSQATEARRAADSQSRDLNNKLAALEQSLRSEKEILQEQLGDKEKRIEEIRSESGSLRSKLEEMSSDADKYLQQVQTLTESNSKYSFTISALEAKVSSINTKLFSCQSREKILEASLKRAEETLQKKEESFVKEKRSLKEAREKDVQEFEAEIDRCNDSMEEAERRFRDSENALKGKIQDLEESKKQLESELKSSLGEVAAVQAELESEVKDKASLAKELTETVESLEGRVAQLVDEKSTIADDLEGQTAEKDNALEQLKNTSEILRNTSESLEEKAADLRNTKLALGKADADLKEEIANRTILERENQEFIGTIETLESLAKRMRNELSSKKKALEDMASDMGQLKEAIEQKNNELDGVREEVSEKESKITELRGACSTLEDDVEDLRDSLKKRTEEKARLEQDNSDLKAWVADLERQATELQSAAENFEDVEMNLREALEAQRGMAEQNAELTEEIRKEREALSNAEAQMRGALRNKLAAEAARDSSQRRASELEERIREIREEHLAKVSQSEEMIRSKARRCAELETELASAERKVAELASVSDMVFSAKVEVNQRDEDIERLKRRAEVAEERAEELEMKVQSCENEVLEMRESGRGEAYKALETEYNELLVCLADLELECVTLKEELGRE